jgi:hypothetical protein
MQSDYLNVRENRISIMNNPETLATLDTQYTGQTKEYNTRN